MAETEPTVIDNGNITVIGHIQIRDPDSGKIIVRQRDITFEKKPTDDHPAN